MVFNVCVKFHENMSSRFKVMERTRNIVNRHTHTHRERKGENYIPPWHTSYARVYQIILISSMQIKCAELFSQLENKCT